MIRVDRLRPCIPTPIWRWDRSCHLFADTLKELHNFEKHLGLRKGYLHDKPRFPHYDLTANKRKLAIKMGAIEI